MKSRRRKCYKGYPCVHFKSGTTMITDDPYPIYICEYWCCMGFIGDDISLNHKSPYEQCENCKNFTVYRNIKKQESEMKKYFKGLKNQPKPFDIIEDDFDLPF